MNKRTAIGWFIVFIGVMITGSAVIAFLNGPVAESNAIDQHCKDDGGVIVISRDFVKYCIKKDSTIDLRS